LGVDLFEICESAICAKWHGAGDASRLAEIIGHFLAWSIG
jgi:hypothetical protein